MYSKEEAKEKLSELIEDFNNNPQKDKLTEGETRSFSSNREGSHQTQGEGRSNSQSSQRRSNFRRPDNRRRGNSGQY